MESGGTLNDDNPLKEVVSPSVHVAMKMQSPVVDKINAEITNLGSYPPLATQGTNQAGNTPGKSSYATVIGESSRKSFNIHNLYHRGNGVHVVVPVESIRAVSDMFPNSAYNFFLGKSVFSSSIGIFFFQFSSMDGLNAMLKNGLWFIRKFSKVGLSVIATKLGTPIMLDSYTANMCLQSWGRSSYARVMIDLRVDVELKDTIMVAMPKINGEGFNTCNVNSKNLLDRVSSSKRRIL
uniref:Zinc knuckle CX2CX4HX4C n=1 Tax=Tanacetum cinerariifolium TaxID=118510 RepID=A0A699HE82_TANCI|nr:hypothetical protein [Tanacetum cinerariifolium]